MERVAIFIDGSNLYHGAKRLLGTTEEGQIDFEQLVSVLTRGRRVAAVYYYNAPLDIGVNPDVYWKQQRFFNRLRALPSFHVVLCRLQRIRLPDGGFRFLVKGDDIHIAVDMVAQAYEDRYDTAILVSGDGDFVPAVACVQRQGKRVENAHFADRSSSALKRRCDDSTLLDPIVRRANR